MSELKRALNAAADDLANALIDELGRRDQDTQKIAQDINLEHLAGNLSLSDLAQEIDLDDVAARIQVGDLVREIDVDDITTRLAQEIDLDLTDLAQEIDLETVACNVDREDLAGWIDLEALAGKLDLGDLSERLVDDLAPHLDDVTKRVLDLQAQMATIGDHLFVLACNLRGDTTATWDATAATLGEAADLVPDNRVKDGMRVLEKEFLVDGNGIRETDLKAVEDELAGE